MDNLRVNLENPLNLELAQPSQHTLLTLNDDCLIELFTYFTFIDDLLAAASTCKRLLGIAQQVFHSKFKKPYNFDPTTNWPKTKIHRYLQYFSEYFVELDASTLYHSGALISIAKSCANLKIYRCNDSGRIASHQLKSSFSKLVQLENYLGEFNGMQLFEENSPLQKLSLIDCNVILPEQHFPHLQHVKLQSVTVCEANVAKFFSLNTQLTRLELCKNQNNCRLQEHAIHHLKRLEELTYNVERWSHTFDGFDNLTKLKKLSLIADPKSMNRSYSNIMRRILYALRRANAPLEFIMMDDFSDFGGLVNTISQFRSVKELVLHKKTNAGKRIEERLPLLMAGMPQLEHITCHTTDLTLGAILIGLKNSQNLRSAFFSITLKCNYHMTDLEPILAIARRRNIRVELKILVAPPSIAHNIAV